MTEFVDGVPRRPPGPHPLPEELYRARHAPRDREAEKVLAHAALCSVCAAEAFRQEAFDQPEAVSPSDLEAQWARFGGVAGRRRRLPRSALLALAAAATLGLGGLLYTASRPRPDLLRGGSADGTVSSATPAGLLDAPPSEFRVGSHGGAPVRVVVSDAARRYRWTSAPTTADRVAFPESERAKLEPGVAYFWSLSGGDGAGEVTSFEIRKR